MLRPLHRMTVVALVFAALAFAHAAAALAVPVHPRAVAPQAPLAPPRAARTAPLVVHFSAAPFRFVPRGDQAAIIKPLPLIAPPAQLRLPRTPVRLLPMLLPRLGLATLLTPLGPDTCAGRRSPVLLAALPTNPFSPLNCIGRTSASEDEPDATTPLVPGRNKDALYGRAYAPSATANDGP